MDEHQGDSARGEQSGPCACGSGGARQAPGNGVGERGPREASGAALVWREVAPHACGDCLEDEAGKISLEEVEMWVSP